MYNVTVLTPRGRRQQVAVTPNMTLLQILEEVCRKHGFNPEDYDLRHHNKIMDISSMFRFTNLPNNAQLEMAEVKKQRQVSPVTLGVQLESGERLMGVFSPTDTVWHAIVTLKPDEEYSSNLVVIYMRQELYGRERLESTTLKSLGLTGGRAMFRLLHRTAQELHTQAGVSTDLPQRPPEDRTAKGSPKRVEKPVESPKRGETPAEPPKPQPKSRSPTPESTKKETKPSKYSKPDYFTSGGNIFQKLLKDENTRKSLLAESKRGSSVSSNRKDSLSEDITVRSIPESSQPPSPTREDRKKSDVRQQPPSPSREVKKAEEEGKIHILGDRNAIAFNLNNMKPSLFEESEDFFELTVADAKLLLQQAKQTYAELVDAPLMTSAQRELERDKKVLSLLNQHKKTVLRIKFLDRIVLQGTFSAVETVSAVEEFVSGYLENPNLEFYLYTTPPKVVLKPEERLIECGCVPSAVLYFGLKQGIQPPSQYLKKEVLENLSTPSGAALTAYESRKTVKRASEKKGEEVDKRKCSKERNGSGAGPSGSSQREDKSKEQKIPKWFKSLK